MEKFFFNVVKETKGEGFFVSHPNNGAKGSVEKGTSKAGNAILIARIEVGGQVLKGVFNKTTPEKLKENPNRPTVWGGFENEKNVKYRAAGWWTTTKKNGEPCKSPYFSCNLVQEVGDAHEDGAKDAPNVLYDDIDIPF